MTTWKNIKFKDFVKLQRGFDLPKDTRTNGKYPVIASTAINGYHTEYKVIGPCVTTGRSGALGEVLYIKENCWPLNTTLWVKDFYGNDQKFVYYKLTTLELAKYNSGAGVPTLNRNHLDEVSIKIPSTNEYQTKITSIISAYDNLIENNEKRIKILEEMAQRLYTEWFVKFKFPGYKKMNMIDSGTEYGMIPEGWEIKHIKDIGRVVTGKTPSTLKSDYFDGKIPFIKTPDIHGNTFIINTSQTLSDIGANSQLNKYLPPNTVFVSCIGTVGLVGITSKRSQTNQQLNAIISNDSNDYCYLYFYCKNLKPLLIGLGATGATMGNVNKDKFENLLLIYPSSDIRNLFFKQVTVVFERILSFQKEINSLIEIRDLLIPQLVTGRRELKN